MAGWPRPRAGPAQSGATLAALANALHVPLPELDRQVGWNIGRGTANDADFVRVAIGTETTGCQKSSYRGAGRGQSGGHAHPNRVVPLEIRKLIEFGCRHGTQPHKRYNTPRDANLFMVDNSFTIKILAWLL